MDDRRDPWGTEMILRLDEAKRTGYFASAGPDKKLGTNDDLICVRAGRKEWDSDSERCCSATERGLGLPRFSGRIDYAA